MNLFIDRLRFLNQRCFRMLRLCQDKFMVNWPIKLALLLTCLVLPGLAAAESMPQQRIELAYDVYLGGFLAGSVDLTVEHGKGRYLISTTSRSHGLLDFLIELRRRNKSQGLFSDRQAKPTRNATTGSWAGQARSVEIKYDAGGEVRFTTSPSAEEDEREAVPPHHLPGTMDPLSALYQAILHLDKGTGCTGRSKVFDGRRRYDFQFEAMDGGRTDGPFYAGPASICRLRHIPISGFSRRTWLPRLTRPEWTDIWLAKLRDDLPPVPVRLQADAGLGAMVAHLVAIGGRKQPPGGTLLSENAARPE